ncbi:MAG TPA: hypothetical protein PKW59_12765, partial [Thermotogota bacterium]|nr:hypothetical protein [Thermotogota bacterium]HPH11725.1 hypothetical protein [Thermotogota bacterium]HPM21967.1 hypothetical protein [Thermotogota bacterium]
MKQRVLKAMIILGLAALGFALVELVLTSRLDLTIDFLFYPGLDKDTPFQVVIKNGTVQQQQTVSPASPRLTLKGLKIDAYQLTVSLDKMNIVSTELNFDRSFDFYRKSERVEIPITELSTVTFLETSIDDPLLRIKWQVKNLKDYVPSGFEVSVQAVSQRTSVNYLEVDIRKLLNNPDDAIFFRLSPVSQEGHRLTTFEKTLSARLANLKIALPPQINSFETSVRVGGRIIQMDPYTNFVSFPYLADVDEIPVEILYYQQPIMDLSLPSEKMNQTLSVPPVPAATVTQIEVLDKGLRLLFALDSPPESADFLNEAFQFFTVQGETFEATTSAEFFLPATHTAVELFIIPQFDYGIQGRAAQFIKPEKPDLRVALTGQKSEGILRAKMRSSALSSLSGRYKVDRQDWIAIPTFEKESEVDIPMTFDQIHSLEIVVEDAYSQTGEVKKWVDPATPQTTFFKYVKVDGTVLKAEWEPLTVYSEVTVTITDNFNRITFVTEASSFETELNRTGLFFPLKIVIKGKYGEETYTAAIEEN